MSNDKSIHWNLAQSYRELPEIFYSEVDPTPGGDPQLIIFNERLAEELGFEAKLLQSKEGIAVLGGSKVPADAIPLAQAYAGHQFGNFTRLGDGRAILLGEKLTPQGEKLDIQLKGSGRTPYSRGGDGRAGLGAMLREYIMSEALYALGIPTTRSLAVVTTGEPVVREVVLEGAIVTRVAQSHLRVGTFEYAAVFSTVEELQALADYTIARHDKEIASDENPYLSLLEKVIDRQAQLIAKWQLVGFIHGVMNTDNMTISGETIDYGPCAFMDTYNPETVFSSIDRDGRYAYVNQPYIGQWNLTSFAESLLPLLRDDEEEAIQLAKDALLRYRDLFDIYWISGMRSKLGIFNDKDTDVALINDLLEMMKKHHVDYTNTFLSLTFSTFEDALLFDTKEFKQWYENWQQRLKEQAESNEDSLKLMRKSNPAVIPRNHLVEAALTAAVEKADYSVMGNLLSILEDPYAHSAEQAMYREVPEPTEPYQTYCGT